MQTRFEILQSFLKTAQDAPSYSATMRKIRKDHPDKVTEFMSSFKEAFDEAMEEGLDNVESVALMQAMKNIGLKG